MSGTRSERATHCLILYLHLQPDECFARAECWHPDPATLGKIRDAIVARPKEWKAVRDTGLPIQGESLKRAPAGYDASHEWIDDIKRKDVCTSEPLTENQTCGPGLLDHCVAACERMAALMRFLAKALDLSW